MYKLNVRQEPAVRNGDRITGDARPGEVVTYRLTPEEIAARYGPPVEKEKTKQPFVLPDEAWRQTKKEEASMAVKMTEQEASRMKETADRIAPTTRPAKNRQGEGKAAPTKRCSKCGREKPLDAFTPNQSWCRECKREYERQKRATAKTAPNLQTESPVTAPKPAQGMRIEIAGSGHMVGPSIVAALSLLVEQKRYRVTMIVAEDA